MTKSAIPPPLSLSAVHDEAQAYATAWRATAEQISMHATHSSSTRKRTLEDCAGQMQIIADRLALLLRCR